MKSPALPLAAAFACGGALTWLLRGVPATPVRDAEGSPARPAAPIRAEDGDVRTSLAAIETVVLRIEDRLRRFEEGAAVPPPERALLDAEPEGTAALAELATLMRAPPRRSRRAPARGGASGTPRAPAEAARGEP